jgi:hypothetical protein
MDWKAKLISSYILADIVKVSVFLPFEARKQRIQMYHVINDLGKKNYSNYMMRAFIPMVLRDTIFRIITLGAFLKQLNVHHQPTLKYKLNDIKDYIRTKEKSGQKVNVSYFMDYSRFHIWDWGLGIGDWGLGPIPNPQSPIPNPQSKRIITHIL